MRTSTVGGSDLPRVIACHVKAGLQSAGGECVSQSQLGTVVPGLTPTLTRQVITGADGGQLVLTRPFGSLQEATNVLGPWTTLRVTPSYTNHLTLPEEFFRLSNP